jgi:hypothetical protein
MWLPLEIFENDMNFLFLAVGLYDAILEIQEFRRRRRL